MKKACVFVLICMLAGVLLSCGHSHTWMDATCLEPRTCVECGETEGEALDHQWLEADCVQPKRCAACGQTEGTALGHMWIAATCQRPQYCKICGVNEGVSLSHNWIPGDSQTPQMCRDCGTMVPLALPESGSVFLGEDLVRGSELTIHTADEEACFVKLKTEDGQDVFSFFVRAGDTVTTAVPYGNYYVYFAYGTDWFGPEYIFGENTAYGKDEEICDFENYTWEYTFVKSEDGNFSDTPISADEF